MVYVACFAVGFVVGAFSPKLIDLVKSKLKKD